MILIRDIESDYVTHLVIVAYRNKTVALPRSTIKP